MSLEIPEKESKNEEVLKMKQRAEHFTLNNPSAESSVTGVIPTLQTHHYYLSMPDKDPHIFNMNILLETLMPLDCRILEQATYSLLVRHDALRSRFTQTHNGWQTIIDDIDGTVPFSRMDLSSVDRDQQSKVIEEEIEKLQGTLCLSSGPLFRVVYFYLGEDRP